ncbi:unnamed protein product [Spirodela intermedia]|uniref:Uncharacterized protein n=1 Tax=Spirodela intermedia TaxID=51605 RepID=A0A7I8IJ69_SPIIN|nr:unnamed protein product [Spirodela intermedia]CAA6657790.1 unnamed protein product [Spirodela intermedia]
MAPGGCLQLSSRPRTTNIYGHAKSIKRTELRGWASLLVFSPSSNFSRQDHWSLRFSNRIDKCIHNVPYRYNTLPCRSFALPSRINGNSLLKKTADALTRPYNTLDGSPLSYQLVPAVGVIAFTLWGLGPLIRLCRWMLLKRNDNNWTKSRTYYIFTSYIRPLLLWSSVIFICRVLNPVTLPSEASQVVKQRLLNFVRSLSTVLTFSFCISSLIQQSQNYFTETNDPNDSRNMGFRFAGKAVYTAVWVAAVSLFMELLGFSTQKWLTAGGLGTVLLTLAGREIFTNFLSSVMIHATRPFVLNEWIQTRIEGYEVSGTVEHVGWWSPTVIRGEDREAVHIPNHKFTVSVVRNLSQKTHWRIKTHLAISHLDVNKISNIVADMRKVLAKNPQVEQRKLHRRVFLDNIDPENQALRILISCFVKTSHFEEYLCVKEAILLDLLRVISHHQARLATPIRTVHKVYRDSDLKGTPFGGETVFSSPGTAGNKTLLLVEPTAKSSGEEKAKSRQPPPLADEEQLTRAAASDGEEIAPSSEGPLQSESNVKKPKKASSGDTVSDSERAVQNNSGEQQQQQQQKKKESTGEDAPGKIHKTDPSPSPLKSSVKEMPGNLNLRATENPKEIPSSGAEALETAIDPVDGGNCTAPAPAKPNSDKSRGSSPPAARPVLEENLVLGVVLDGAKRTLPIEEGMGPSSAPSDTSKELTPMRSASVSPSSSSGKDKKDGQTSPPGVTTVGDPQDQER